MNVRLPPSVRDRPRRAARGIGLLGLLSVLLFAPAPPVQGQEGDETRAEDPEGIRDGADGRADGCADAGPARPSARFAGPEVERARILGLFGSSERSPLLGVRRISGGGGGGATAGGCGPSDPLRLAPVSLRSTVNTGWARSRSDEGAWGGRGVGGELRAGVAGIWGPVELALVPSLHLEQNRGFEIPGSGSVTEFHYPWQGNRIDWALRPGEGSEIRVVPGQSHLSLVGGPFRGGISTQPLWWGPAVRFPVLMSGTAAGFPHFYLGTERPLRTRVGTFDFELFMGRPSGSDPRKEFEPDLPDRGFTGLLLAYSPPFAEELTLGAAAVNHANFAEDFSTGDQIKELLSLFFDPFALDTDDNIPGNALAAVYARWRAPDRGLELYLEVARNDHAGDFDDLMQEPDHSLGFTAGFQKAFERGADRIRILGEVTDLRGRIPLGVRGTPVFFRHSRVRVGHTHEGQLLGAPVGPGALAVHVGADLLSAERGLLGVYVERTEYDADAHRIRFAAMHGPNGRDREWTLGTRHHRTLDAIGPLRGMELSAEAAYSRRVNRLFLGFTGGDEARELPVEGNLHLDLRLTWRPAPLVSR